MELEELERKTFSRDLRHIKQLRQSLWIRFALTHHDTKAPRSAQRSNWYRQHGRGAGKEVVPRLPNVGEHAGAVAGTRSSRRSGATRSTTPTRSRGRSCVVRGMPGTTRTIRRVRCWTGSARAGRMTTGARGVAAVLRRPAAMPARTRVSAGVARSVPPGAGCTAGTTKRGRHVGMTRAWITWVCMRRRRGNPENSLRIPVKISPASGERRFPTAFFSRCSWCTVELNPSDRTTSSV